MAERRDLPRCGMIEAVAALRGSRWGRVVLVFAMPREVHGTRRLGYGGRSS